MVFKLDESVAKEIMNLKEMELHKITKDGAEYKLPSYSADIFEAMKVAEHIDLFRHYMLHKTSRQTMKTMQWCLSLVDEEGNFKSMAYGDTAAEAICKAALFHVREERAMYFNNT